MAMKKDAQLYNFTQTVQGTMFGGALALRTKHGLPPFEPLHPLLQVKRGYAESPGWFLAQAREFDPEALTVQKLRVRDVYASERIVQALLEIMASEKWFDVRGAEYHLTDAGRELLNRTRERTLELFTPFQPMSAQEIERLELLLRRIIETSLTCPEPPGTWSLRYSRRRAPDVNAPMILKLFYHFSDLNAYRDDAHMAAFQPHHIQGYEWEAFSFICDGASTADEIYEQLAHRGYSRHDYAAVLDELAKRGWLAAQNGGFIPSERGRTLRAKAEQLTDDYFYAAWSCLDDGEFDELCLLLVKLNDESQRSASANG
jgi:hypothetical protein